MATKIYAVRRGRTTGLFTSWADCQKQVTGFAGARFKSFTDPNEAMRWLNGDDQAGAKPKRTYHRSKTKAAYVQEAPKRPDSEQDYVIYTDGSCLVNPLGPGGWAMVACETATGEVTEKSGGQPSTTNNRMELTAALMAFTFVPKGSKIALYTDSQYLKNGITKWAAAWKRRGWKKADGQPVLNQDLWQALDAAYQHLDVTFHWVKGHAGIALNERCDKLAKQAAMQASH